MITIVVAGNFFEIAFPASILICGEFASCSTVIFDKPSFLFCGNAQKRANYARCGVNTMRQSLRVFSFSSSSINV